ncbi:glycosyltransferase [Thiothrix lacustris]|uniref:Glycosyltransferase n=1 Tax=Thiothrix lacustris TaxID=525917 RepID=A0ABY9MP03_9GAMM|nr:glycosyltransferase [Thiothrix lacustris]WML90273.1 glycosyltransferase [Thiothrix lacustris]
MMENKTKKICVVHIITGLDADESALMLYKLLAHIDRSQFEPVVISLDGEADLSNRIRAHGITVYSLDMSNNLTVGWQIFKLAHLLRSIKPDIIQGWMYHGNLATSLANLSLGNRYPLIWTVHNTLYNIRQKSRTTRWIIELTTKRSNTATRILYNTELNASQHISIGYDDQHTQIIPNGFDTQLFSPNAYRRSNSRQMLGIPEDAIVIGMFTHDFSLNDHTLFLEATHLLLQHHKNVHFLLVGQDLTPEHPSIISLLKRSPMPQNIHLLGERKDTHSLMNTLDIFSLISSSADGFPNSVIEAMACGIPCITTDIIDLPHITGHTGQTLQTSDTTPSALAFIWLEWINAGEAWRKEMGLRGMAYIQQHYNIRQITDQYQATYKELVNHGRTNGFLLPFQQTQFSRHAEKCTQNDSKSCTQGSR